jgi:hypothetical protein
MPGRAKPRGGSRSPGLLRTRRRWPSSIRIALAPRVVETLERTCRAGMFEPIPAGDVGPVQGPADPFPHCQLPQEPLVHCPVCGSGLIYPLPPCDRVSAGEVECRCPDCEHTGVVVTTPLVAAVWRRRSERAAAAMWCLAEAITEDRAS